jgi:hypothetical protein
MQKLAIVKHFADISESLAREIEKDAERTQDIEALSRGLKAEPREERYTPDHKFGYCQLLVD